MTGRRVVVVGSGIAGLTAARHAAQGGCRVTLVTKDVVGQANTRFAQGGIAAVMFDDDAVEDHIRDTLVAGAGLCDPAAVRVLAEEGPARVRDLVDLGVAFDRTEGGDWVKGLEGAHSYPRILHAGGDATGAAIEDVLVARLGDSVVEVLEHAFLVDLVVEDGAVVGVDLLLPSGRTRRGADAVILATGGAGRLYAHTTNPPVATGDGIAAALRAGAAVADLEFVQFHPTVLAGPEGFLVSEAVRGEGAVLLDAAGDRFMPGIHPAAELAPRDVVARAIWERMAAYDGAPVRLDATALRANPTETARFLAARFPTIDAAVRARGFDWAREPIPVTPAAHYLMGGVVTDLDGRTSLTGLYAVGEVSRTGVNGANRLASNSLLEGAVFGARAGAAVATGDGAWPVVARAGAAVATGDGAWQVVARAAAAPTPATAPETTAPTAPFTRAALQQLMWERAGLVRDAVGLAEAAAQLAAWRRDRAASRRAGGGSPASVADGEDDNLLTVAAAVVAAAAARTESVGAHYRADASTTPENLRPAGGSVPKTGVRSPILRSYDQNRHHEGVPAC